MENSEVKKECESLCADILKAKNRLAVIRSKCQHEVTFQSNFSYRVGSYQPANICWDCGALVSYIQPNNEQSVKVSDTTEAK